MIRWLVVFGAIAGLLSVGNGAVQAQSRPPRGAIVALRGTSHLWIADASGVLHWAGDTRALSDKFVDWNNRQEVSVDELKSMSRGEPWLSAGLLKSGDPIYFVKWESDWSEPQLLHIQSIVDVELFGIDGSNYGRLVMDESSWQRRFGVNPSQLGKGKLQPATGPYQPNDEGLLVTSCNGASECSFGDSQTWYLESGKRRLVPDIETLLDLRGKNGDRYSAWPNSAIERVPRGDDVASKKPPYGPELEGWVATSCADGGCGPGSSDNWLLQNGRRRWVPDGYTYIAILNRNGDLWTIMSRDELTRIPRGSDVPSVGAPPLSSGSSAGSSGSGSGGSQQQVCRQGVVSIGVNSTTDVYYDGSFYGRGSLNIEYPGSGTHVIYLYDTRTGQSWTTSIIGRCGGAGVVTWR